MESVAISHSIDQARLGGFYGIHRAPPWLVSMIFHLVMVIALALMATSVTRNQGGTFDVVASIQGGGYGSPDLDGVDGTLLETASMLPQDSPTAEQASTFVEPMPVENAELMAAEELKIETPWAPSTAIGATASSNGNGSGDVLNGLGTGIGEGPGTGGGFGEGPRIGTTDLFGLKTEGTRFVYVFDHSESMTSTYNIYSSENGQVRTVIPLEVAKRELMSSINQLHKRHEFQIVFYNHQPTVFPFATTRSRPLVKASAENKRRVEYYLGSLEGAGGTYHMEPLELALQMRPNVIYLLTDGEERDDPTEVQLARLFELNGGRASINVIQFVMEPRPAGTLKRLAEENRGQHTFVDITRVGQWLKK